MRKRLPLEKRFWAKVNKQGPIIVPKLGRCWEWLAGTVFGYGEIYDVESDSMVKAHRVAWFLTHGEWPENVLHRCDNKKCVRLSHLFSGSLADNNRDRNEKGRQAKGSTNGRAKLTEEIVREIRVRYRGDETHRSLAATYGVHPSVITEVLNRKIWTHVA